MEIETLNGVKNHCVDVIQRFTFKYGRQPKLNPDSCQISIKTCVSEAIVSAQHASEDSDENDPEIK